jgi:hypothetical protein
MKGDTDDRVWIKSNQKAYRSKTENSLLAEGKYSWKEDIRDRVRIAKAVSRSVNDFEQACKQLGLDLRIGRDKQYVFIISDHTSRCVGSAKLGSEFRKDAILRSCVTNRNKTLAREEVFDAISDFGAHDAKVVAEAHPDGRTTLRRLAHALTTISMNGITSLGQLEHHRLRASAQVRAIENRIAHTEGNPQNSGQERLSCNDKEALSKAVAKEKYLCIAYETALRHKLLPSTGSNVNNGSTESRNSSSVANRSRVIAERIRRERESGVRVEKYRDPSSSRRAQDSPDQHDDSEIDIIEHRVR